MALAVFWAAATTVFVTYVVMPVVILVRGVTRRRPYRTGGITPTVSVVIAARNEARVIGDKLHGLLSLDYPPDLVEIVVASDGSTDGTDIVVRRYEGRGVRLISRPADGKAAALNAAVAASTGEILVFTDANSMLDPAALRALVRPFADPEIGGVAGNQVYSPGTGGGVADGERRYWDLDRLLKQAESEAGSTVSATGAIYAVRRGLFRPVPDGVTDDFVTSTRVVAQGHRLVFEPAAIAFEPVAESAGLEFDRKVRVMTRGLRGVLVMSELLDVRRHGMYSVQLVWHKVLRRMMAVPLLLIGVVTPFLWSRGPLYRAAGLAQLAFSASALAGLALGGTDLGRRAALSVPAYFAMVNAASLVALANVLRGRRIDGWNPARSASAPDPPNGPVTGDRPAPSRGDLDRLRGGTDRPPDVSAVIPVNAAADLGRVTSLIGDLIGYRGSRTVEIVLVVNNYHADDPPAEIEQLRALGARVLATPSLPFPPGIVRPLAARLVGAEAAGSELLMHFDADCRITNPTALLDWYATQLVAGAGAASTDVGFYDLPPGWSIQARVMGHGLARWVKRVVLRIPLTRGSNYATQRTLLLDAQQRGLIADELNVGPAIRSLGASVRYSSDRRLRVLTSGRRFEPGWRRLLGYLLYRLRYNMRTLPVSGRSQRRTRRWEDPEDRWS